MIALSLSLFYYLVLIPVHRYQLQTTLAPFTHFEFVLFVLSVVCVAAAGNIINDYLDFELDKEFKPLRPLPSGDISLNTAMYLHMILAGVGIALGFFLGANEGDPKIGYIYVISVVILYLYSLYLKKLPLIGNIVIAGLTALIFLLLLVFEAAFIRLVSFDNSQFAYSIILSQIKFYAGFAFITSLAREVVKDLEDREGDAAFNINTIAVQFGEPVAKVIAIIVLCILFAGLSYFMSGLMQAGAFKQVAYLFVTVILPVIALVVLLLRAHSKEQYARISLLLKVVMLMGILSIPAFYLFSYSS